VTATDGILFRKMWLWRQLHLVCVSCSASQR
jgi:hypothetical protein